MGQKRPILLWYLVHPFGSILAKFEFAADISPVLIADEVKSDDFGIRPDLDLT